MAPGMSLSGRLSLVVALIVAGVVASVAFLEMRALKGVEWVTADSYARTVSLGDARGWIRVTHARQKRALMLDVIAEEGR